MGIFYYVHSVALIEDLPLEAHYKTPAEFYAAADKAYGQVISYQWINSTNESIFSFHGPISRFDMEVPYDFCSKDWANFYASYLALEAWFSGNPTIFCVFWPIMHAFFIGFRQISSIIFPHFYIFLNVKIVMLRKFK